MAVYSVDSDAVLTTTAAVTATSDRLQADAGAMHAQLVHLQSSWTGVASTAFQTLAEDWRAAQRQVDGVLASIAQAMASAGRQYAEVEAINAGLFR